MSNINPVGLRVDSDKLESVTMDDEILHVDNNF